MRLDVKNKRHVVKICRTSVSFLLFFSYLLFGTLMSYAVSDFIDSAIISSFVTDVIFGVFLLGLYLTLIGKRCFGSLCRKSDSSFSGFSPQAMVVIFFVFICLYYTGQATSAILEKWFPSSYMQVYTSLSNQDIILYSLMSITVAPIVEELLFRGFLYQYIRTCYSPMVCYLISSVLFGIAHGTLGHFVLSMGLSLFLSMILEITGELKYAIFWHMLYNLVGISYLFQIKGPVILMIVLYVFICIGLFVCFMHSDVLRKYCVKGKFRTPVEWVEKKVRTQIIKTQHDVDKSSDSSDTLKK